MGDTITTTETPATRIDTMEIRVAADALGTAALEIDHGSNGSWMFGYRFNGWAIEGSYISAAETSDRAEVADSNGLLATSLIPMGTLVERVVTTTDLTTNPNPVTFVTTTFPVAGVENTFASIFYQTEMESAEVAVTWEVIEKSQGTVSFLAGMRYITIEENAEFFSVGLTNTQFNAWTENRVFGPELGILFASPLSQRGTFHVGFKGGVGLNESKGTTIDNLGIMKTENKELASLIGDFKIGGALALSPHLGVQAGFMLLSVNNVGLALDSISANLAVPPADPIAIPTSSDVTYYSPYVGAVFSY